MYYAGFFKRFAAYLIDGLILAIPFGLIMALFGPDASDIEQMDPEDMRGLWSSMASIYVVLGALYFAYFAYFESSDKQATPGKSVMKLKVTNLNGDRISFMNALGRNAGKIVSAMIFYIGFIMAAFTQKKQALHDIMASTLILDNSNPVELNTDV